MAYRILFSAVKSRGLIEAVSGRSGGQASTTFSAVKSRGLIEATLLGVQFVRDGEFSAVKSRGLIEASPGVWPRISNTTFSAVKSRGLIEAVSLWYDLERAAKVFRGEEPRPH